MEISHMAGTLNILFLSLSHQIGGSQICKDSKMIKIDKIMGQSFIVTAPHLAKLYNALV